MPFEYFLEPTSPERAFAKETLEAMQAWLMRQPLVIHHWSDSLFFVFCSEEERDIRLRRYALEPHRNDYLTPTIEFSAHWVCLSTVTEETTDRLFYDFVCWCQLHWPCQLYYGGGEVPPEDLLARP